MNVCISISLQVNIIPVIAKADTISKSELHKFKIKIMSELVSNGVQIYQFPLDDETVAKVNTTMNVRKHTPPLTGVLSQDWVTLTGTLNLLRHFLII